MPQPIVLVVFYSRGGATERLAHAAAVGAVQKRAAIRLRRMADADPQGTVERFPEHREDLRRMHKEYVAPRETDVEGADALIVGSRADVEASATEWAPLIDLLRKMQAEGRLARKAAAVVGHGAAYESLSSVMRDLGLAAVPADPVGAADADAVNGAVSLGREVVAVVEAIRGER